MILTISALITDPLKIPYYFKTISNISFYKSLPESFYAMGGYNCIDLQSYCSSRNFRRIHSPASGRPCNRTGHPVRRPCSKRI